MGGVFSMKQQSSRVSCKKLGADIPASTCIARQKKIAEAANRCKKHNGPAWGFNGMDYAALEYVSCVGCEVGLELFKKRARKVVKCT